MMRTILNSGALAALFAVACASFAAAPNAAAQTSQVEPGAAAAPNELAPAIRDALAGQALRVSGPAGAICEIWLRNVVPAIVPTGQTLGIVFPQLADGTLIGAIRFVGAASDFRRQQIKPGVYTMRYALQPVDGNHLGLSPNRDFVLLAPAAVDTSLATVTGKDLYTLSRKASGTGHPSVWNLVAAEGASKKLPAMAHINEGDLWVIYFQIALAPAGGAAAPVTLGLVIVGHAEDIG